MRIEFEIEIDGIDLVIEAEVEVSYYTSTSRHEVWGELCYREESFVDDCDVVDVTCLNDETDEGAHALFKEHLDRIKDEAIEYAISRL